MPAGRGPERRTLVSTSDQRDRTVAGRTRVRHRATPGGGAAAGVAAATGAALIAMVGHLTSARKGSRTWMRACDPWWRPADAEREAFLALADEDAEAFESVMASFRLPKETDEEKASRTLRIQEAYEAAAAVPLQLATRCVQLMELAEDATAMGNPHAASDGYSAGTLLFAAALAAMANVRINAAGLKDEAKGQGLVDECDALRERADALLPADRGGVPPPPRDLEPARRPLGLRFEHGEDRFGRLRLPDAAPLARFWAAALGWTVAPYDEEELERLASKGIYDPEDDPSVMFEPPERDGSPVLFFTEVPEEKVAKNRVHLDLAADGPIEDEVQRLEGLGAARPELDGGRRSMWCVMLDPQGNEFCVVSPSDDDDADQD